MAEVKIGEDETPESVAQELLAQAEHPDHVVWTPRANTLHGGVFTVPDEKKDLIERRKAARAASREAVERRIQAQEERDRLLDETGATPDELGLGAFSDEDRASLGMPGAEPVEIDPAREPEQRRMEADARRDGVAEAQDAQVARAQERQEAAERAGDEADEAEGKAVDAEIAAEDQSAEDRARARRQARKNRTNAQAQADAEGDTNKSDKE